jgi:phosphoglucosamine mutase
MLALLKRREQPASQLFNAFTPSPQKLENLPGLDPALLQDEAVKADLAKIEQELGDAGRILVRPSGTEALIRVMVEADDDALLEATMAEIILRLQKAVA